LLFVGPGPVVVLVPVPPPRFLPCFEWVHAGGEWAHYEPTRARSVGRPCSMEPGVHQNREYRGGGSPVRPPHSLLRDAFERQNGNLSFWQRFRSHGFNRLLSSASQRETFYALVSFSPEASKGRSFGPGKSEGCLIVVGPVCAGAVMAGAERVRYQYILSRKEKLGGMVWNAVWRGFGGKAQSGRRPRMVRGCLPVPASRLNERTAPKPPLSAAGGHVLAHPWPAPSPARIDAAAS
jgi:hypothetical protein